MQTNKIQINPHPLDSNFILRWLHIHTLIQMYNVYKAKDARTTFTKPRFQLFAKIKRLYSSKKTSNSLLKNIIYTYKLQIFVGFLVTCVFACLNLLVPQLIKSFLHQIHAHQHSHHNHNKVDNYFAQKFVILQLLRLIFGQHSKRLFKELAIKVESALSKKLIQKSLKLAKETTDVMPQFLPYKLQNVDLKLIFLLFKNMYIIFQFLVTVVGALALLFMENSNYGIIGIYWFLIAFFVQRQLDGRMSHCNKTKLSLIDQRSKINYQILGKIKAAKLSGCENLLVQKNNDLFIHENHDHELYYFYSTLYDISLLLLPIMVVVTISIFDIGQQDPITIQKVYVMLSLLQICYRPMKQLQTMIITFHDGTHALQKITNYFAYPNEVPSTLVNLAQGNASLFIKQNTVCVYPRIQYDFQLIVTHNIQMHEGQRLLVVGKKGQGISSFIYMLTGSMKKIKGNILMTGKIAYCPQKFVFGLSTLKENIQFFNNDIDLKEIQKICGDLKLLKQLKLQSQINAQTGLSPSQLQRISLARVLCSKANIYILDNPFQNLSFQYKSIVQQILRKKQKQGVLIVIACRTIQFIHPQDKIVIMDSGKTIQYGTYSQLAQDSTSNIEHFIQKNRDSKISNRKQLIQKFSSKIHRQLSYVRMIQNLAQKQDIEQKIKRNQQKIKSLVIVQKDTKKQQDFSKFLKMFLAAASPKQTIFIYLIIISAELLHIFIHFFIGHQYEQHQQNNLSSFRNLMILELILTLLLSGIIFLQGQVSSKLAVIKGNKLYQKALTQLVNKSISQFNQMFYIKLADKFNHDYEEIFIAWHNILSIYKNLVILFATISFVSSDKGTVLGFSLFISIIYISILMFLKSVQKKVVTHYYHYKYSFVRAFQVGIAASQMIKIYKVRDNFLCKVQTIYTELASYKLAQSYISNGQQILCDIVSIVLLGLAFQNGEDKISDGKSTAFLATAIFLLMNLSQVLKNIVKLTTNLQSFFHINLQGFMKFAQIQNKSYAGVPLSPSQKNKLTGQICIRSFLLNTDYQDNKKVQVNLQIPSGETVLLLQKNQTGRQQLFSALTKNIDFLKRQWQKGEGRVQIGQKLINNFTKQDLNNVIAILSEQNFFRNGTLRDNISWNLHEFDENKAQQLAYQLKLDEDLQILDNNKLIDTQIDLSEGKINSQLSKKIALLRIFCLCPKVVIIKDTSSFIGDMKIVQLIKKNIPQCTIIKISNKIQVCFDVQIVCLFQNLKLVAQQKTSEAKLNYTSKIGNMIRQSNIDGYLYTNMASVSPRKIKSRMTMAT